MKNSVYDEYTRKELVEELIITYKVNMKLHQLIEKLEFNLKFGTKIGSISMCYMEAKNEYEKELNKEREIIDEPLVSIKEETTPAEKRKRGRPKKLMGV